MRQRILEFDPATYQIRQSANELHAFELLRAHFRDLVNCDPNISNVELVKSLNLQQASGRDSYFAIEAYFSVCSALVGDSRSGYHSFTSPMGDIAFLSRGRTRQTADGAQVLTPGLFFMLSDCENNTAAMMEHLEDTFFLPKVLIMSHTHSSDGMTHPDPVIELPEPLDYIASGKVLEKCKTKLKYELYATVLYQGANADHAIAFIKMADSRKWFVFNDQKVEEKGGNETLKDEKWLSTNFNWPALFFYRRL